MTMVGRHPGARSQYGRDVLRPATLNSRHAVPAFARGSKPLAQAAHRAGAIHADVVNLRILTEHAGDGESTCERSASEVDDDRRLDRAVSEELATRDDEFLQMSRLIEERVQQDTIVRGQNVPLRMVPALIEIGLAAADHFLEGDFAIDAKTGASDGAGVLEHGIDDFGLAQPLEPCRQFDGLVHEALQVTRIGSTGPGSRRPRAGRRGRRRRSAAS